MKNGKCTLLIMIFIMNSLLLAGCWNYRDIEKYSIVTGFAIDKGKEEGKYLITVEVVDFEMMGKEPKTISRLIESEGYTMFDAIRNMIDITGKRLYWGHVEIVIISQDIAREGINPILDLIFRDAEMREEMHPIISGEKSAKELLLAQQPMKSQLSATEIYQMLQNQTSLAKTPNVQVYEIAEKIMEEGISPVMPLASMVQMEGKPTVKLMGTALFKKDKFIGFLDEEETKYYLFAANKVSKGLLVESEDAQDKKYNITLEIYDNKTRIRPVYSNDKLVININIVTDAAIAEIETSRDYISKEGRKKLKADAQRALKTSVENVIKKVQTDYKTDAFCYGKNVRAQLPSVWRNVGDNWNETFSNLEVNVNVDIRLRNSALLSKPIVKGE